MASSGAFGSLRQPFDARMHSGRGTGIDRTGELIQYSYKILFYLIIFFANQRHAPLLARFIGLG
jgi:hypothetical protein